MQSKENGSSRSVPIDIPELNFWRDELGWSNNDLARAADVEKRTIERMYQNCMLGRRGYAKLLESFQKALIEKATRIGLPDAKYPHTLRLESSPTRDPLEDDGDSGQGALAVGIAVEQIELNLPNDTLQRMTREQRDQILKSIQQILKTDKEILVTGYREGSVKMTIAVTPEEAERLMWAVRRGDLQELGVENADPIDTEIATPALEDDNLAIPRAGQYQKLLERAEDLYRQDPDWVTFFREVVGIDGAVRKTFPSFDELTAFEKSEEFAAIQKMLVKLRATSTSTDPESEPTRVITIRLPKSMHEYLRTEAHDLRTSMNKLCISKLLQVIGEEMIPNERSMAPTKPIKSASIPSAPNLRRDIGKSQSQTNEEEDSEWPFQRFPR